MIRCNNCGTDNLDGSEYCDECGMKLSVSVGPSMGGGQGAKSPQSAPPMPGMPPMSRPPVPPQPGQNMPMARPGQQPMAVSKPEPPPPPNFMSNQAAPKNSAPPPYAGISSAPARPAVANEAMSASSAPPSPAPGSYGKAAARAKLIIQRGGTIGKEFMLTDSESNIGRWDADGGIFPDVDLDQDDPEAKVSRRHARIIHQNGQYVIEDLGSTNGTFINRGRRLLPGNRHPLNNGDEIIVGKTFLKFVVEA